MTVLCREHFLRAARLVEQPLAASLACLLRAILALGPLPHLCVHPLLRLPQEVDGLTTRLGPALSDLRPRALLSRRNLGKLALAEQRGDVVDLPHNVMLKQRTRPLLPARTGEQLVNKPLLALERSPRALPGVWADPIVLLLPPLCPPPSPPPHP